MSRRIVFTFSDGAMASFSKLMAIGKFESYADCVRDALSISSALCQQSLKGYSTVIVQNPETEMWKEIILPRGDKI